jgi:serine/threonine-protein kinase
VAALVAYYEGRFDDALKHLQAIGDGLPWFYEAPKLRGDILFARALGFRNGGDSERALSDIEGGRQAYTAAAAIGRSVPSIYESLGEFEHTAMVMELYGHGDVTPVATRALDAVAHALATKPDHYEALVLDARVRRNLAEHQMIQGVNAEDVLGRALASALRAVKLSRDRSEAWLEIARIYYQLGSYRTEHHDDPSEQFRQVIAASDTIPAADRDVTYYENLALTLSLWADYEDENGGDGQAHRDQSIATFTQALHYAETFRRKDKQRNIWINVAINWFQRATVPRAQTPDADLQQAVSAIGRAKRIDRQTYVLYHGEGRIHEALAQRVRARGGDPRPDLNDALAAYRNGLAINPTNGNLYNGVGSVFQALANAAWDRGDDPAPLLEQALAAYKQAISVAPEQVYGYDNVGEILIQRAGFQRAQGQDPSASVKEAVATLDQAIEKMPNHPTFRSDLAMAHIISAGYELEHGRDPQPSLRSALAALQPALDKHSSDSSIQIDVAEIQGVYARLAARAGLGKAGEFRQVAQAFEQAIALGPDNEDHAILFGQFCRAWAMFERDTSGDPEPALTRGLALVNQVLVRHPSWPDALVLRASLTLVQARRTGDVADRRAQAEHARQDFDAALTANRSLNNVWAREAELSKRLASSGRAGVP